MDNNAEEFADYIRDCIRELTPASTATTLAIPDLSHYLPDDGDSPEEGFDGLPADGKGKHETFDRGPDVKPIPGRNMGWKPPTRPGGATPGDGDRKIEDEYEPDDSDRPGPPGPHPKPKPGPLEGKRGGDYGRSDVDVKSRAFLRDPDQGVYVFAVHPPTQRPRGEVFLSVAAVGDDALPNPVRLRAANLVGGRQLDVSQLGRVGPVAFPKTGPLRVEVTLAEPRRLALDVTAYEGGAADEAE